MEKNTLMDVSDLTHTPRVNSENEFNQLSTNYQLTYEETKKREEAKNKTSEKWEKKANHDIGSAISDFFGDTSPDFFLTLTFRDKRIVNGTNVGHRIDLNREYDGYIPTNQIEYLKKEHAGSVGVQRTNKAIKDFFYKGMFNYKTIKNDKPYWERTDSDYKIIRSNPMIDLCSKFVYVVELGSKGQRRHIHALFTVRREDTIIKNLFYLGIKKNLHLWNRDQGFVDVKKVNLVNKNEKCNYIAKNQYIAKDFAESKYENYSELFGSFDMIKKYQDLRDVFLKKNMPVYGMGIGDVTTQQKELNKYE